MLKKQWQHVGWMFIYILAMPIFGLFIPLYSFWHFDDFSWGMTRRLKDQEGGNHNQVDIGNAPDPLLVLKTWDEYVTEINYNIPFTSFEIPNNNK